MPTRRKGNSILDPEATPDRLSPELSGINGYHRSWSNPLGDPNENEEDSEENILFPMHGKFTRYILHLNNFDSTE